MRAHMNYDLPRDRQAEIRDTVINNLRHDRAQALLDIERFSAIPENLQDGSEAPAIDALRKRVAVVEAQLDALLSA